MRFDERLRPEVEEAARALQQGEPAAAAQALQRCAEAARAAQDVAGELAARLVGARLGPTGQRLAALQRIAEEARARALEEPFVLAVLERAQLLEALGQPAQALGHLVPLHEFAERRQRPVLQAVIALPLGRVLAALGLLGEAQAALRGGLDGLTASGHEPDASSSGDVLEVLAPRLPERPGVLIGLLLQLGAVTAQLGQHEPARACLDAAAALPQSAEERCMAGFLALDLMPGGATSPARGLALNAARERVAGLEQRLADSERGRDGEEVQTGPGSARWALFRLLLGLAEREHEPTERLAVLERAGAWIGRGAAKLPAELTLAMGRAWLAAGDPAQARAVIAPLGELDAEHPLAGPSAYLCGEIELASGRPGPALAAALRALSWASAQGAVLTAAHSHRLAAAAHQRVGSLPLAIEHLEQAASLYFRCGLFDLINQLDLELNPLRGTTGPELPR